MSPQVLSILNNAKMFLSDEELNELACAISKDLTNKPTVVKKVKQDALSLRNWTKESVTEYLLGNQFRPKKRKQV